MGLTSKKERYASQDYKLTVGQLKVVYTFRVLKNILFNKDSGAWVFLGLIELLFKVSKEPGSQFLPYAHAWLTGVVFGIITYWFQDCCYSSGHHVKT